jgi:hypothetical protein
MHDLETNLSDYWEHLIGQSQQVDVDAVISGLSSVVTEDSVMIYPLGADVLRGDELLFGDRVVDDLQLRPLGATSHRTKSMDRRSRCSCGDDSGCGGRRCRDLSRRDRSGFLAQ